MSLNHAARVLAGIVPDRKDLLLHAVQHLEEDHFAGEIYKGIFRMLNTYYDVTMDVLPSHIFADSLSKSKTLDTSKALLYEEAFAEIENLQIPDHEFRYSVDALKRERAEQLTGEAITTAFEIFQRGAEVGRDHFEGAEDARKYAYSAFAEIDKLDAIEVAPEGDMRHEASEFLEEYEAIKNEAIKNGEMGQGILTGIKSVDQASGGFGKGELIVAAAFTNAGKTQFCCQTAWDAAVMQGKNVFFATSETVRTTVRRRIIARHSRLPQFGLEDGLDSTSLKRGTLSPKQEAALKDIVHDLDTNPNYGKLYICQIPRGATLSYLEARMNRQGAMWEVDLAIMDYVALLKSDRKRSSEREEMNEVIKDTKVFATSFNDGAGVPFVTPWQIRRESHTEALRTGSYGLASLSDTAEIEKSADQILTMLRVPENPKEVTLQFLKMRDGDIPNPITLRHDFRNAYLTDEKKASAFGAAPGSSAFGITGPSPTDLSSFGL